jgi:hypothetical protein
LFDETSQPCYIKNKNYKRQLNISHQFYSFSLIVVSKKYLWMIIESVHLRIKHMVTYFHRSHLIEFYFYLLFLHSDYIKISKISMKLSV